jgi:hypothetical protein
MSDLDRIGGNVQKMISLGAPAAEIDGYLAVEGFTPEAFRAANLQKAKPEKGIGEGIHDFVSGVTDAAVQGLTFGFADELGAGIRAGARGITNLAQGKDADFGATYDRALEEQRQREKEFSEENPVTAGVANVAGGLATGGVGTGLNATAGREALPILQRMFGASGEMASTGRALLPDLVAGASTPLRTVGRAAAAGAVAGGVGGFGAGEGGVVSRLESAGTGAAIGAALGTALPVAGKVIGEVYQGGKNLFGFGDDVQKAQDQLNRAFKRDKVDLDTIPTEDGKPLALVDKGGSSTLRLGRTVETIPGEGSDRAQKFLNERQLGQAGRVGDDIETGLGGDDFYKTIDDLDATRKANAAPLYDESNKARFVWSDEIETLTKDRPSIRKAMARAREIAEEDGMDPKGLGLTLDADGNVRIEKTAANMRTLDLVKRGLDDVLEESRNEVTGKLKLDNLTNAINGTRKRLVAELDRLNPKYAEARRAWGGPTQSMEAVRLGRDFAKGDPEATLTRFKQLSPGDQNLFRLGVAREIKGIVESTRDGHDAVAKIFGSPAQRDRLKALFPDEATFSAFEKAMKAEATMSRTRRVVTGGSITERIKADQSDAGALGDAALDYAGGGVKGVLFGIAKKVHKAKGLGEKSADELSKMLFDADPVTQKRVIGELIRRAREVEEKSAANVKKLTTGLTTAANVTSQQIAPYKR